MLKYDNIPDCLKSIDRVKKYKHYPPIIGVYFLVHKKEVVYIGQSINVFERINMHIKYNKKIFDNVYYIKFYIAHLSMMETHYIKLFNPKYNKRKGRKDKKIRIYQVNNY